MIKFCKKCYDNHNEFFPTGYSTFYDNEKFCPVKDDNGIPCGCEFIEIDFPKKDLSILTDISNSKPFIDAMINLYQTDIIEYELKMSQFRQQLEGQKQAKQDNQLCCPYCHSTDVKKITMTSKVTHGAVFGLFGARKILKQWHCNKCKSDF